MLLGGDGVIDGDGYMDRTFTFKFDDDHIFDIGWTFTIPEVWGEDGNPYWYLCGIRYGTVDDVLCDYGESGNGFDLIEDPIDDFSVDIFGDYIVEVDGEQYTLTLAE